MTVTKSFFFLGAFFLVSVSAFCANVSVLIVETGIKNGLPERNGEVTGLWESGLMDVFFEAGHIVTNAPAFAIEEKPRLLPGEIQSCILDAEDGGVDYFILGYLNYDYKALVDAGSTDAPRPVTVNFELYQVKAQRKIWTQRVELSKTAVSIKEELLRVKRAARSLIVHLGDAI
jgi:hypothetical protein